MFLQFHEQVLIRSHTSRKFLLNQFKPLLKIEPTFILFCFLTLNHFFLSVDSQTFVNVLVDFIAEQLELSIGEICLPRPDFIVEIGVRSHRSAAVVLFFFRSDWIALVVLGVRLTISNVFVLELIDLIGDALEFASCFGDGAVHRF